MSLLHFEYGEHLFLLQRKLFAVHTPLSLSLSLTARACAHTHTPPRPHAHIIVCGIFFGPFSMSLIFPCLFLCESLFRLGKSVCFVKAICNSERKTNTISRNARYIKKEIRFFFSFMVECNKLCSTIFFFHTVPFTMKVLMCLQKLREETQRAATERAKLENILMEKQLELEALNKEIETQRTEKDGLEKRVTEVLHTWTSW